MGNLYLNRRPTPPTEIYSMPNPLHSPAAQAIDRWFHRYVPGIAALVHYQRTDLRTDCIAGLSVAAVCLPVGIAYAEIAGVPAVYGIYSALLPLLAYALFGSSRQLITGPDAATCLMVAAALGPLAAGDPQRYMELMISLTLITGVFNIIFGLCRFGFIANFFSHPILIGYLNGVALIILAGQLPKLFGYRSEGGDFFGKLLEFTQKVDATHLPTVVLGGAALGLLFALKRWAPRLPAALLVAALGIAVVEVLQLQAHGVAVLGAVPAGLPSLHLPSFDPSRFKILVQHGAGIALISFTSGILTAKSFARRNRYAINANQELIAFGACNIVSGLAQGFPVTGADSRTAVNNAMGGKTQLVGIVAAGAMLLFLLFFTTPLASLPTAALAAIIAVASIGLIDLTSLRELYAASRRELTFSLVTTAGVLYFDVLPAVFLAIMLTFLWMLLAASQPRDAVLGQVPGITGFHNIADYPHATTIPGLLLYRFEGNILFFNVDYFKERILAAIAQSPTELKWVVIDAGPVNFIDITGLHNLLDLRRELEERGIELKFARVKQSLGKFFNARWVADHPQLAKGPRFDTLASVVEAFAERKR
jgi:high affinity sulfate transporter 1